MGNSFFPPAILEITEGVWPSRGDNRDNPFIQDQTLQYMNKGLTAAEIQEKLVLQSRSA